MGSRSNEKPQANLSGLGLACGYDCLMKVSG